MYFFFPFLPRCFSDPASLRRLFSPHPHYGTRLRVHREKGTALSSLVDSHRIAPTRAARRSQRLILSIFIFADELKGQIHVGFALQNRRYYKYQ